jgi:hypothetical protein
MMDEVDASAPAARQRGMYLATAWLAARGIDLEQLDPDDLRIEVDPGQGEATLRFLVRASAVAVDSDG